MILVITEAGTVQRCAGIVTSMANPDGSELDKETAWLGFKPSCSRSTGAVGRSRTADVGVFSRSIKYNLDGWACGLIQNSSWLPAHILMHPLPSPMSPHVPAVLRKGMHACMYNEPNEQAASSPKNVEPKNDQVRRIEGVSRRGQQSNFSNSPYRSIQASGIRLDFDQGA